MSSPRASRTCSSSPSARPSPRRRTPGNPGVLSDSYSLAYDALVFASLKTPDNIAYQTAKVMYENGKSMGEQFGPFRLFDTQTMAKDVSPVEYHPGAVKFYKEAGIWPAKGRRRAEAGPGRRALAPGPP